MDKENFKKENIFLKNKIENLERENRRQNELAKAYFKRIDKAVEYNQFIIDNYLKEDNCEYCDGKYSVAKKNINILKGDDTNEI